MLDKPIMPFHIAITAIFLLGASFILLGAILLGEPEISVPTDLNVRIEFDREIQK